MFHKLLIANRGEIALRIIRTCRELGIRTVIAHSTADAQSLPVRMADESICVGPDDARGRYLNIAGIISAAVVTDSEAIHPGYGFLAENPAFAEICRACGLTFVGPSPEAIRLMGDKAQARVIAKQAGVPVVPGSELPLKHESEAGDIFIDPFNRGRLLDTAGCAELLSEMTSGKEELQAEHLESVSNKRILARILLNLLGIYQAGDPRRALATIERLLLINPNYAPHVRLRGMLLASVGDQTGAIAELERYLMLVPEAEDFDAIKEQIQSIHLNRARLN